MAGSRSTTGRGDQEKRSEIAPRFVIICVLAVSWPFCPYRRKSTGGSTIMMLPVFWPGVSSKILGVERTFDPQINIRRQIRTITISYDLPFLPLRKAALEHGRLFPTWLASSSVYPSGHCLQSPKVVFKDGQPSGFPSLRVPRTERTCVRAEYGLSPILASPRTAVTIHSPSCSLVHNP
jgi:hypothetical protein